jgi:hypothetical protein
MGAIPLGPTGHTPWRQGDRERTPKTGNRHLPARAEGAESARFARGALSRRAAVGPAWFDPFGFPQSFSPITVASEGDRAGLAARGKRHS